MKQEHIKGMKSGEALCSWIVEKIQREEKKKKKERGKLGEVSSTMVKRAFSLHLHATCRGL
jgi:hypothetical protein